MFGLLICLTDRIVKKVAIVEKDKVAETTMAFAPLDELEIKRAGSKTGARWNPVIVKRASGIKTVSFK